MLTPEGNPDLLSLREASRHLTPQQRAEAAAVLLEELQPGRQPFGLFKQFARLTFMSTAELTPVRTNDSGETEVLLTQRPADDTWWPNQWHLAGSALIADDVTDTHGPQDYELFYRRLFANELPFVTMTDGPHLFDAHPRLGIRGPEQTVFHFGEVEVTGELPPRAGFFIVRDVIEAPPEGGLIIGHGQTIAKAALAYEHRRRATQQQQ